MARLDAEAPVTRAELEDALRLEGFRPQDGSPHVWWSQDRTKFLCFPDEDSGEAIYGDSEIGEPGKTIPIETAHRIVRGELLLESPLGVIPVQRQPERMFGDRVTRPRLRAHQLRALPARIPIDATFEPADDEPALREPPPVPIDIEPEPPNPESTREALRSPAVALTFGIGIGVAVMYGLHQARFYPPPAALIAIICLVALFVYRRRR